LKLLSSSGSVFFPTFSPNLFFSSFSVFFGGGFSSGLRSLGWAFNEGDFRLDEAARPSLQVFALQEDICSRLPESGAPKILFHPGVPSRQQAGQSTAVVEQTRQPRLLPRPGKCAAGSGLAGGASGLLEAAVREATRCVTRDLLGASGCK